MRAKKDGRGRPEVDSEEVRSRMTRDLLDGISKFASEEPDTPARSEAVRRIVRDWLIGHGYLPLPPEEPR